MTINEAIKLVDKLKPNQYDYEQKVKWLSKLDGMIFIETFMTHSCSPVLKFSGYDNADPDTILLVPFPYDEDVYNYFLQAQIDKENGEMAKYNQSITLFNNSYKTFQSWYNIRHMPLNPSNFSGGSVGNSYKF